MPGKTRALVSALRFGAKYGPMAYEAAKHSRRPAQAVTHGSLTRMGARRQALQHASSLIDGSAMRVFHGDKQVWVVFTGDLPVATHPRSNVPIAQLLQHADLSRRVYPRPAVPAARQLMPGRSAAASGPPRPSMAARLRRPTMRRPNLRVLPGRKLPPAS
ncbi:hypothetical protein [Luteipulveratus flavus]|uniref:TrwC relaxase domain-containing protein n=1 Tax=Luteipulveratus flavus TaxID=3031728 RepID=A0ABT6CC87_9MICO|nr:hypothetical protein [Luteipulveratus sp. YIM 133296]MDF8265982.1 hypothetical protein [Luteipulveratus sp. YIM 133296]